MKSYQVVVSLFLGVFVLGCIAFGQYSPLVFEKEVVAQDSNTEFYAIGIGDENSSVAGSEIFTASWMKVAPNRGSLTQHSYNGAGYTSTEMAGTDGKKYLDLAAGSAGSTFPGQVWYLTEDKMMLAYSPSSATAWNIFDLENPVIFGTFATVNTIENGAVEVGKVRTDGASEDGEAWFLVQLGANSLEYALSCWYHPTGGWGAQAVSAPLGYPGCDIAIGECMSAKTGTEVIWGGHYSSSIGTFDPGPTLSVYQKSDYIGWGNTFFRGVGVGDVRPGDTDPNWAGPETISLGTAHSDSLFTSDPIEYRFIVMNFQDGDDTSTCKQDWSIYGSTPAVGDNTYPRRVATGDLNNDGLDEFVVAAYGTLPMLKVFYWNYDTNSWGSQSLDSSREYYDVEIADVDGDGFKDILYAADGEAGVYYQHQYVPTPKPVSIPNLYTEADGFEVNSHITSTTFFPWFISEGGQSSGPWLPLDGRENWNCYDIEWLKSQIKQIMMANIDVIYVHMGWPDPVWYAPLRENFLRAIAEMRADGYDVPKIAPFIGILDDTIFNVGTESGKDDFVNGYITFFNQYYESNMDSYADSYLAQVDGRVVLDMYHLNEITNSNMLTRLDVESRLSTAFGQNHPVFNNNNGTTSTIYMLGSTGSYFTFCDEVFGQFGFFAYYTEELYNGVTVANLKGGSWDQNIRTPGLFLARDGGIHYDSAWSSVNSNSAIDRVYIESWNEYDEGTGIYAADPINSPYIEPGSSNPNTDTWSDTDDPYEYIKTTAQGARIFNDHPDYGSKIIWHNIPTCISAGEERTVYVVVRNAGDVTWSEADMIRFGQNETLGETLFGASGTCRWTIDNLENEVSTYGGVFRGRPVIFELNIVAPDVPGNYTTTWSMVNENGGTQWFGEEITVSTKVLSGSFFYDGDFNNDCYINLNDFAVIADNWLADMND